MILFVLGCAAGGWIREAAVPEPFPSQPVPGNQEPIRGKDPFRVFPEKYRLKTAEHEKTREFDRALFSWKIVAAFLPGDEEASERIRALEAQIRKGAEEHFLKGLNFFLRNSKPEAAREFLMALTYQPDHEQALDNLKRILTEPDYFFYQAREGDTLPKISRQVYKSTEMAFLIAYFNDLNSLNPLKAGMTLKIPAVKKEWMAKPAYPQEIPQKSDFPPNRARP